MGNYASKIYLSLIILYENPQAQRPRNDRRLQKQFFFLSKDCLILVEFLYSLSNFEKNF